MERLIASPGRVGERINACRRRVRHRRAAQRTRAALQRRAEHEEHAAGASEDLALAEGSRMASVAEILSGALGEMGWLEEGLTPGVDERTPGRTGLSGKEELGEEVGMA